MELKDKYYNFVLKTNPNEEFSVEEKIVFSILQDFTDRGGLSNEWEQIDDDIQEEIIETWLEIVKNNLK